MDTGGGAGGVQVDGSFFVVGVVFCTVQAQSCEHLACSIHPEPTSARSNPKKKVKKSRKKSVVEKMRSPRLSSSSSSRAMAAALPNPKRSAADPLPVFGGGGSGGGGGGEAAAAKRRRTVVPAAALTAKIAALEAAVDSGKTREAALGRRIAELEAENATLRKRPRLPERPAALQQLVQALGGRERDLEIAETKAEGGGDVGGKGQKGGVVSLW